MITMKDVDPEMIADNLTPAIPTHPGEILKDEIEFRGISQRQLAEQMGVQYSVLNEILNKRRPQLKYNMQTVRKDKSFTERLAKIRKVAALL